MYFDIYKAPVHQIGTINSNTLKIDDGCFKNYAIPGHFKYIDKNNEIKQVAISKVLYNNPVTVVFWDDGTKTVAKCDVSDVYSVETGLAICIEKKLFGVSYMKDVMNAWLPTGLSRAGVCSEWRTLADARRSI